MHIDASEKTLVQSVMKDPKCFSDVARGIGKAYYSEHAKSHATNTYNSHEGTSISHTGPPFTHLSITLRDPVHLRTPEFSAEERYEWKGLGKVW